MKNNLRHKILAGAKATVILIALGTPQLLSGCTGRNDTIEREADLARLRDAVKSRDAGFMVTVEGVVERILADDEEGSRHQRFILEVGPDLTLLVSHNIDLAQRVPVEIGDSVEVRGQYEWNPRGGVLHWTHRDPAGRRASGWIRHREREFR